MNLFGMFNSKSEEKPPEVDPPLNVGPLMEAAKVVPPASDPSTRPPLSSAMKAVHDNVVSVLKSCYDPEIPVNIYELGLIYDIEVIEKDKDPLGDSTAEVVVRMTLTSPMCPVAGSLPPEVQFKIGQVPHVVNARVDLVWEPQWNPNKMTEAAKLQLGLM